jgi:DMSO/TMAO reductase YedYZ heme-binding membrane subunit
MWRKALSVVLLIVFMISVWVIVVFTQAPRMYSYEFRGENLPTEAGTKLVLYGFLAVAVAILSLWLAARLNGTWRRALGVICFVFSVGSLLALQKRMESANSVEEIFTAPDGSRLVPYFAVLIPVGTGLILYQKRLDKKVAKDEGAKSGNGQ